MPEMSEESSYAPGVCNIGPAEIRKRLILGWLGTIAALLIVALFVALHVSRPWRVSVIIPVMLGAMGFLQAGTRFCAAYGVLGLKNFGENAGTTAPVESDECFRQDRAQAMRLILAALFIALVVDVIFYIAPV